jgi:hypothetical protein
MTTTIIILPRRYNIKENVDELYHQLEEIAKKNVITYLNQKAAGKVPDNAILAMVRLDQVKQTQGKTLVDIYLRRKLFQEIETNHLWMAHPDDYASMAEAIEANGISQSEYSNTCDLCDVIFPYLEEHEYDIQNLWETIGKSKFRELIPFLKRIITNKPSRSRRVETFIQNEISDIASTDHVQGKSIDNQEVQQMLVHSLIDLGHLSVRHFRERLNPEQKPIPKAYQISIDDTRSGIVIVADQEDIENLSQRLTTYLDVTEVNQDELRSSSVFWEIKRIFTEDDSANKI